jgi:catechol 2,3-dioxygenase-like lactoylglutathione lyase family enzyme
MSVPQLVSIEFTVPDLAPCVELLRGVLGFESVGPERHPVIDADIFRFLAGSVVITLLCPTDTGVGVPHSTPEPRLSQLNFTVPRAAMDGVRVGLEGAGAVVVEREDSLFYLDPEMVKGLFGAEAAFVFTPDEGGRPDVGG